MLDYTIRICSTPTTFYFDLYLYSVYAEHYVYNIEKVISTLYNAIKRNHFKMYMFGAVRETHAHNYFEVVFSDMSLIINYVICVICISKKLKYLKNEARESKIER